MKKIATWLILWILMLGIVCGATGETLTGPAQFQVSQTVVQTDVTLNTEWFDGPATAYQHGLATASSLTAGAAYRSRVDDLSRKDENIRALLEKLGFGDYEAFQYDIPPTGETIANALACMELTDEQGSYVLIAAPVSGGGYGDEWLSNLTMGDNWLHEGFALSAEKVLERFDDYVSRHVTPGTRIKVWTTGFSRAAAVSNLFAAALSTRPEPGEDNVFAYTFATPAVTRDPLPLKNIYNIVGAMDPVPLAPFPEWGFDRYGSTLTLPAREIDSDFARKAVGAAEQQKKLTGSSDFVPDPNANWLVSRMVELLHEAVPDSTSYAKGLQNAIRKAWTSTDQGQERMAILVEEIEKMLPEDALASREAKKITELLLDTVYDSYMELQGEENNGWVSVFTSGLGIFFEHSPVTYSAWMLSSADGTDLFVKNRSYSRVLYFGDSRMQVSDGESGELILDTATDRTAGVLPVITLGDRHYVTLPGDRTYKVTLIPEKDGQAVIGFITGRSGKSDMEFYSTGYFHAHKDQKIGMTVTAGLEDTAPTMQPDSKRIRLKKGESDLLLSGEMDGAERVKSVILSAGLVVVPHFLALVLMVLYAVGMGIRKLTRIREPNLTEPMNRIPARVMQVLSVICLAAFVAHSVSLFHYIFHIPASFHNELAHQASTILNRGLGAYEGSEALLYLMLGILCFRGVKRSRTRARCFTLCILMAVLNLLEAFYAVVYHTDVILSIAGFLLPLLVQGVLVWNRRMSTRDSEVKDQSASGKVISDKVTK